MYNILSRRFILKKYLGLDEDELVQNEVMWRAENNDMNAPDFDNQNALGGLGVRGGDIEGFTPTDVDDESPEEGDVGDAGPETTDSPRS